MKLIFIFALLVATSFQCDISAKIQYNLEEEKYVTLNKLQVFQTLEEGINLIFFDEETLQKVDSKVFKTAELCEEVPQLLEFLQNLDFGTSMIFQTYLDSAKCFQQYPELKQEFDEFFSLFSPEIPSLYDIKEQNSLVIVAKSPSEMAFQYVKQENSEQITELCLLEQCETLFGNTCQTQEFLNQCYNYLGGLKEDTVLGYMGFQYNKKNHKKEITMDFFFKDLDLEKLECFTYDLKLKDSEIKIEDRRPTIFDKTLNKSQIRFVEDEQWLMDNGCIQYQDNDYYYWQCSIELDIIFAGYVQENFSETMIVKLQRTVMSSIDVQYQEDNSKNPEFSKKSGISDMNSSQQNIAGKDQIQNKSNIQKNSQKQQEQQDQNLQEQTDSSSGSKTVTSIVIIFFIVLVIMVGYMGYKKYANKLELNHSGRQRFQEEI